MKQLILKALEERKIFVGVMMLCRYLNGRGYIRYGCNVGYPEDNKHGNARIIPCPILCPNTKIYPGKIKYHLKKLLNENLVYMEKRLFYDARNKNSKIHEHKVDLFIIVAKTKKIFDKFIGVNTLEKYLEVDP